MGCRECARDGDEAVRVKAGIARVPGPARVLRLSWQSGFERVKKPESGVGGAEKEFLRPLEFWVTAVTNIPTLRRHCPDAAAALAALAFFAA
ncbi:hypothetical protein DN579_25020 [Burkholderia multivorans]|nr:hypothetical protein DN579_25020 [Burkholderia multivorans]